MVVRKILQYDQAGYLQCAYEFGKEQPVRVHVSLQDFNQKRVFLVVLTTGDLAKCRQQTQMATAP